MEYIFSNIYLIPMGLAIIVSCIGFFVFMPRKTIVAEKNIIFVDEAEKPFNNYISNTLYEMSFRPPFVWFCPEDPEEEKARLRNSIISKAGLDKIMDYRVFMTMQIVIFIFAILVAALLSLFFDNSQVLLKFLFNIDTNGETPTFLIMLALTLLVSLIPNIYIKFKADSRHAKFIGDLPILQLFIILMIRSNRTIPEIFYVLSKSEMRYTEIFSNAYRIFLRNRHQAFVYLRSAFYNTPMIDTLTVLETFDEYSRDDSIAILQNQLTNIIDDVAVLKKNKNVLLGLVNEGSIALPFIAIMLLGVIPVVFYGLGMMSEATNSGITPTLQ